MHYSHRIRNFTIGDHHIINQSLTWALIMMWIIARTVTSRYCISLYCCLSLALSVARSHTRAYVCDTLATQPTMNRRTKNKSARNTTLREKKSEITLHAHMIIGYAPHLRNLALKQLHYITYYYKNTWKKQHKQQIGVGLTLKLKSKWLQCE